MKIYFCILTKVVDKMNIKELTLSVNKSNNTLFTIKQITACIINISHKCNLQTDDIIYELLRQFKEDRNSFVITNYTNIDALPFEIKWELMSKLDVDSFGSLCKITKGMRKLCSSTDLWRNYFKINGVLFPQKHNFTTPEQWVKEYKTLVTINNILDYLHKRNLYIDILTHPVYGHVLTRGLLLIQPQKILFDDTKLKFDQLGVINNKEINKVVNKIAKQRIKTKSLIIFINSAGSKAKDIFYTFGFGLYTNKGDFRRITGSFTVNTRLHGEDVINNYLTHLIQDLKMEVKTYNYHQQFSIYPFTYKKQ